MDGGESATTKVAERELYSAGNLGESGLEIELDDPIRMEPRESGFPNQDYYWSLFGKVDEESAILNISSIKLHDLIGEIEDDIAGKAVVIVAHGVDFEREYEVYWGGV